MVPTFRTRSRPRVELRARESASGLKLIDALSRERWVTDEDRAKAISILSSLSHATEAPVAELRASILGGVRNPAVAAELERVPPSPKGRFELYVDSAGAYRWRLKDANGKLLAVSEGHPTKLSALSSLELARRELGSLSSD